MFTDISDHLPVFTINKKKAVKPETSYTFCRHYTQTNINKFSNKLRNIDWSIVLESNQCQESYSLFHKQFLQCYESCFPLCKVKTNYRNRLTSALKQSINVKNKLYVKSLRKPSDVNINTYKQYRNKLNSLLRKVEQDHYAILFRQNQNNFKKCWSVLKEVINKNKKSTVNQNQTFMSNGKLLTDKSDIVQHFNNYFSNIGSSLAKNLKTENINPLDYVKSIKNSIFLKDVDSNEVKNIIVTLKNTCPGYDNIHTKVIKSTYNLFLIPLTHVLNQSIDQGIFSIELKNAKIIPLFKGGDTMLLNNYRPVSILSIFSKVLKKLMYNRLFSFLSKNKLLYKYQFGFRKGYSTNMALITLVDKILTAINNGEYVIGVFLDLRKAFDTVNHEIL